MSISYEVNYENLYSMSMSEFYEYVAEIMSDFNFIFHRSALEVPEKRRGEVWVSKKYENDYGMVWIELTKNGENVPEDIATDILRAMNDEIVTKLFFFTNGGISEDVNGILKGKKHYIFDATDIIETMQVIKKRKEEEENNPVRKEVSNPSGFVLIKNYLKSNKIEEDKYNVKVDQVKEITMNMIKKIEKPLDIIDEIEDLNKIPKNTQDKLKKIQYALLSEMVKVASLNFGEMLQGVKESMLNLLKSCIIYIGAVVQYESEDSMNKYREDIEKVLESLRGVEEKVEEYKKMQINKATNISFKLILISVMIILFCVFFYLLILKQ